TSSGSSRSPSRASARGRSRSPGGAGRGRSSLLGFEAGDLDVTEGERVALVVVVRFVPGEAVVHLELVVLGPALGEPEGDAVEVAPRVRGDGGQGRDAVDARGGQAGGPRRAEERVVLVEEARDLAAGGVVVLREDREVGADLPLDRGRGLVGARVPEIPIEDEHVGQERAA